jgi:hypothetical protein
MTAKGSGVQGHMGSLKLANSPLYSEGSTKEKQTARITVDVILEYD